MWSVLAWSGLVWISGLVWSGLVRRGLVESIGFGALFAAGDACGDMFCLGMRWGGGHRRNRV